MRSAQERGMNSEHGLFRLGGGGRGGGMFGVNYRWQSCHSCDDKIKGKKVLLGFDIFKFSLLHWESKFKFPFKNNLSTVQGHSFKVLCLGSSANSCSETAREGAAQLGPGDGSLYRGALRKRGQPSSLAF